MKKLINGVLITTAASLLVGCGGGDGASSGGSVEGQRTTGQGQLVDSPVAGLHYISGSLSGKTGPNGEFEYEIVNGVPSKITFSFGTIEIGTALGQTFLTPVEIAQSNQIGDDSVTNVVRLLLTLDEDGDSSNGVQISSNVADAADIFEWEQIDFTDVEIDSQIAITQFLADYGSIRGEPIALVDSDVANDHLQNTLNCLMSGLYFGSFDGSQTGPIALGIDPSTMLIGGLAWSRTNSSGIGMPLSDSAISLSSNSSSLITVPFS